jgi:hypothetical protein
VLGVESICKTSIKVREARKENKRYAPTKIVLLLFDLGFLYLLFLAVFQVTSSQGSRAKPTSGIRALVELEA